MKKIICLDFDGVIHSYASGWNGARNIPDPPVDGALQWMLDAMAAGFEVHVLSSRSRYWGGRRAMRRWLKRHALKKWPSGAGWHEFGFSPGLESVKFVKRKPPAFVSIDDRGLQFTGTFPDLKEIGAFRPWNKE